MYFIIRELHVILLPRLDIYEKETNVKVSNDLLKIYSLPNLYIPRHWYRFAIECVEPGTLYQLCSHQKQSFHAKTSFLSKTNNRTNLSRQEFSESVSESILFQWKYNFYICHRKSIFPIPSSPRTYAFCECGRWIFDRLVASYLF